MTPPATDRRTDGYLPRTVDLELDELAAGLPAIVLGGAKGVGKTLTAQRRAATVVALDDPATRALLAADLGKLLAGKRPVLIDEWQRMPETWDLVRRAVDAGATAGSYLLTGSAVPLAAPTHSGAGRIVTLQMRPLALHERGVEVPTVSLRRLLNGDRPRIGGTTSLGAADYAHEIVQSGFPGIRDLAGRALRAQLDGYLARIAEHDFAELGHRVRNPMALRRWMQAYAAATATTASYEATRDAATGGQADKPARSTTLPYRDVLQRLWIIEPVPAWLPSHNRLARLSQPAKHHLADPALAARLLGIDAGALVDPTVPARARHRGGTLFGALFEGLVTLGVRVAAQAAEGKVAHLRTAAGEREVDLIVERGDGRVVAIAIKLAQRVDDADVRHLAWLRQQLGDDLLDVAIITTGRDAYRRRDGIAVVPAALLGP